jgi:hypothetical protein
MQTFPNMLSIPSTKCEMSFLILTTLINLQIIISFHFIDNIIMIQTHIHPFSQGVYSFTTLTEKLQT